MQVGFTSRLHDLTSADQLIEASAQKYKFETVIGIFIIQRSTAN